MIEGQNVRSIDTGELVWAVAFGCGTAVTTPNSINLNWWRYRVPKDLILATGLNSGKIRTWNVRTGKVNTFIAIIEFKCAVFTQKSNDFQFNIFYQVSLSVQMYQTYFHHRHFPYKAIASNLPRLYLQVSCCWN